MTEPRLSTVGGLCTLRDPLFSSILLLKRFKGQGHFEQVIFVNGCLETNYSFIYAITAWLRNTSNSSTVRFVYKQPQNNDRYWLHYVI